MPHYIFRCRCVEYERQFNQLYDNLSAFRQPFFLANRWSVAGCFFHADCNRPAIRDFVVNPIAVGKCRFFIANRQNRGGYDQIFSLFRSGVYLNVVKTMFLRDLYTVLWSLLLIVPGIVKSYEYSMIPYILAENPQIDSSRAFAGFPFYDERGKSRYFYFGLVFLRLDDIGR